jgi:glycosyltransferase involved in cell wall biosynthesis
VNTKAELTIVIPAKNESKHLPILLTSLSRQDYPLLPHTKVFVADAGSTDGTVQAALAMRDRLNLTVVPGGLPSVGRNAGARLADTPYVLFVDADVVLHDRTLLRRALEKMRLRQLHCLTTNIWCPDGNWRDHLLYAGNNLFQYAGAWIKPFATGMFMLFDKARFDELGGFNENALFAEDYLLSKRVSPRRFGIVSGKLHTTNRRFRKMGHARIATMFLRTALNSWNESYFLRDHGYWGE